MAYILRTIAVVGVIALNSPVHGDKPEGGAVSAMRGLAVQAARIDTREATQSLTAAREAAEILAGLDPQTRDRLLQLAMPQKPR